MSRCFPYPPLGHALSRARNEALIESIKLQKEKERKKEKKERRKEKKEERRERKRKRKIKSNQNLDKPDIPKHLISQRNLSSKKVEEFFDKKREIESEQLEQSSVTEEHARPPSMSVPSTSSDSTQNNINKRKRLYSPGQGKVILLRLPSMKQNELDAALGKEQQPCSTSGRSDFHAKSEDANCVRDGPMKETGNIGYALNLENNREKQIYLTSQKIEVKTEIKPIPDVVLMSMPRLELQYKNLLDCFPTQIQDVCLSLNDLDWLFQGRNQEARTEKKRRFGSESLSCSRSFPGLWPLANYLQEVDIYALPFTVPY